MPDKINSGNSNDCCTAQNIHSRFREAMASALENAPIPPRRHRATAAQPAHGAVELEPERDRHQGDQRRLHDERRQLLQRLADQDRRSVQRTGQHALVGAQADLEQQVRTGGACPEQADHHDHARQEPLQRRRSPFSAAGSTEPASSGPNRPRRPAAEPGRRSSRTDHGAPATSPAKHGPGIGNQGAHAATSLSSRRLRPVRLRKTSSSVGTRTSAARTSTPA